MVTDPPGPGATFDGNEPTETHRSAAETDVIASEPPPAFTILNAADDASGFVVNATNESSGDPRLN
jgi:hypothetical protein